MTIIENYKIVFVNEQTKDNIEDCDIVVILPEEKDLKYDNLPVTTKFVVGYVWVKRFVRMPFNCKFICFGNYYSDRGETLSFCLPERYNLNVSTGNKKLDSEIKFRISEVRNKYEYILCANTWKSIFEFNNIKHNISLHCAIVLDDSDDEKLDDSDDEN